MEQDATITGMVKMQLRLTPDQVAIVLRALDHQAHHARRKVDRASALEMLSWLEWRGAKLWALDMAGDDDAEQAS